MKKKLRTLIIALFLALSAFFNLTFGQSCSINGPSNTSSTISVSISDIIDLGIGINCSYEFSITRTGTYLGTTRVEFTPSSSSTGNFSRNQIGNTIISDQVQGPCAGISGTIRFVRINDMGNETGNTCSFEINAVLPVELATLSATLVQQNKVTLKWTTLTESNNEGFEIQRSSDALDWKFIDFVAGQGTTNTPVDYEYQDKVPFGVQQLYYRLKQMDQDGAFEYSPVINVNLDPNKIPALKVYPNPTTETLNIVSQAGKSILFNATGQPLRNLQLQKGTTNINISDLPTGTYMLQIELENGNRISERFIKGK